MATKASTAAAGRTPKAPVSAAKLKYKELSGKARAAANDGSMWSSARAAGAAKGAVTRFTNTRGVKGGTKRPVAGEGKPAKKAGTAAAKPRAKKAAVKPAAAPVEKPARKPRAKKATPAAAAPAAKPARTSKAPASAAKTKYKELSRNLRMEKDNPYGDSRTIGAAKGRVTRFENTRGVKGGPKRPVASEPAKPKKKAAKAAAKKAAPATRGGAIVRSPGGAIVPVSRAMPAAGRPAASAAPRVPASQRPGSMTSTLRGTLRTLAQSDARMMRDIQSLVGGSPKPRQVKGGKKPSGGGSLPAAPKKPKSRPASGRKIDDAKARRIVERISTNRPNLRPASGSNRRSMNAVRTYDRASDFILAATKRNIKKGKGPLGVVESTKRAVANATKPRKTAKKR